ncbi:MAG: phosphoribosylaminoimidazolesuccinocarboxamide synthase [Endomicrobiia bacterium]
MLNVLLETKPEELGLKLFKRGKVRDIYDLQDSLLIISTDRISCFDVVLPCGIPYKGYVLTQLSCFWFEFTKDIIKNHFITADLKKFPVKLSEDIFKDRAMLVKKSNPLPVECVVRGYLSGSGWKEYKEKGTICGIKLPSELKESEKLPEPIFTPSTKANVGHDINITEKEVKNLIGKELTEKIKEKSIAIYKKSSEYAEKRGIIIADTKFEFGISDGELILIDEVLTPDSSRFWPKDEYKPGRPQISFDKQFVRDYLETLNWDKTPPAPMLPEEIIQKTSEKYIQALEMLTGKKVK